ncbi:uncharacterized protein N7498_007101 [Penicillium cinerascens]|uniref:RING-type E3 ubiquitin transferase n=1 Tax=Penicillium cinerascens TaxID=70096 RepID=A0A9W9JJ90_9EURO|nr:uncharacterized protein N7498_007101 [Penicillium cinerascens]KAJ5197984.1 hypothetical protein N7498_007101 [Penicillium cinerascens]
MAGDGDLQREILQRTLKEVADEETEGDPCVICLETITEPSVAVPCKHSNFDYLCLLSWLEQQPNCPLCKVQLTKVQYDLKGPRGPKTYNVPPLTQPSREPHQVPGIRSRALAGGLLIDHSRRRRPQPNSRRPQTPSDDPLAVRRNVYRNQLYSLRVGSNRLSQYTEVTPEQFNRDENLASRARKWIRRELQVFAFLNPGNEEGPTSGPARPGSQRLEERRANNAEFLLEYVIAILRTVDIKGSAGQAEELLRDFIGRDNARLFLHELLAWLRSPYTSLQDWDRHVQYPSLAQRPNRAQHSRERDSERGSDEGNNGPNRQARRPPRNPEIARGRSASPVRDHDRSLFDRISRPEQPSFSRTPRARPNRRPRPPRNRSLLDRYIPD